MRTLGLLVFIFLMVACSPAAVDDTNNNQTNIEEVVDHEQGDDKLKEEHEQRAEELTIEERLLKKGNEILIALKGEDFQKLSDYVHPEKGIRFSPYGHLTEDDLVFSKGELIDLFTVEEVYNWGIYDAIGTPIELTARDYYERFIFDVDFTANDEVVYNTIIERGNTIKNIHEFYPEGVFIEYFKEGTEEYAGMDWRSLYFLFEEEEQSNWFLVAIIHDEWTS